jgi:uncharacterized radical SAM superfamily Fe-S cluster-containing enzyme
LLERTCPEHGAFEAVVWRGENIPFETWGNYVPPKEKGGEPDCPNACGLCAGHLQKTCCVLLEVTSRCNLRCPVCFAESGGNDVEPSVESLFNSFKWLAERGKTFVQLSGGEPTVRDDLPDIVAAAKRAGCEHIQLNSNGIRLGQDRTYLKALKDAGLSFVFMQFDGTEDAIYTALRGRALLKEKLAAIDACGEERIGVTLVPTIVPGVNDRNIGDILRFGISRSPDVRGVHFQPVSYFGRYPTPPKNADRITLPEIITAIEKQTDGKIKVGDLLPSACDHPRCGFHGDFAVLPKGALLRLTKKSSSACCCDDQNAHLKNRSFVSRRWKRSDNAEPENAGADYQDMDNFLKRIKSHGFTVTGMAFQDAYTLDIERLRRCSLHVFKDGRVIPFCARYLTPYAQE